MRRLLLLVLVAAVVLLMVVKVPATHLKCSKLGWCQVCE